MMDVINASNIQNKTLLFHLNTYNLNINQTVTFTLSTMVSLVTLSARSDIKILNRSSLNINQSISTIFPIFSTMITFSKLNLYYYSLQSEKDIITKKSSTIFSKH